MSILAGPSGSTIRRSLVIAIAGVFVWGPVPDGWSQGRPAHAIEAHLLRTGPADPGTDTYAEVVGDTIGVVLERQGITVRTRETEGTILRYEYHLVGFLPRLHVCITVCDAVAETRIAGALTTARSNITLYSAVDELVVSLQPAVEEYLDRRSNPENGLWPVGVTDRIVVPAGGDDARPIRYEEIATGTVLSAEYIAVTGVVLPVRVSQPGFHPEEISLPITDATPELPHVPLRPLRRFGAEVHAGYPRLTGAGIGARFYPLPDRAYAALDVVVSMTGLSETSPGRMVHAEPRLLVGYVPFGTRQVPVQPVISTGVGLVSTFVSYTEETAPRYFDWYWNVVNVAVEVGRGMIRPYLRGGISYYLETDQGLWERGLNPDRLTPEIVGGTVLRW